MSRSIVVPTDLSSVSEEAFPFAANLAHQFDASIVLVHVMPSLASMVGSKAQRFADYEQAVVEQATIEMERLVKDEVFAGLEVSARISSDPPTGPAVLEVVQETEADLVVLSNHGRRGVARLLLGSVAEEIVRTAPVPVLMVGHQTSVWKPGQRILVPIDFSPVSLYALEAAARLSRMLGLEVQLVHVVEPPQSPFLIDAMPEISPLPRAEIEAAAMVKMEGLAKSVGLERDSQVTTAFGGAKERIVSLAQKLEPGLIVLGSHGRRGLGRVVLGSVAEGVVRASGWPTLVVKNGAYLDRWPGASSGK